jgi:hypothetical protein
MDELTSQKLASVLNKESARRRAVAQQMEKEAAASREREEKKRIAREQWQVALVTLQSVVKKVNSVIVASDLSFEITDGKKAEPTISQTIVRLLPKRGDSDRMVVLNVNAYGSVHPVFLIPHSGQAPSYFQIGDMNPQFLSALLVEFLDQTLSYEDKNGSK